MMTQVDDSRCVTHDINSGHPGGGRVDMTQLALELFPLALVAVRCPPARPVRHHEKILSCYDSLGCGSLDPWVFWVHCERLGSVVLCDAASCSSWCFV